MPISPNTVRRCGTDPDAIEAVYRAYRDDVWRFLARRTRDGDETGDLVGEVFMAVIDTAEQFDEQRGSVRAWLFGIAWRRLADRRRQGAREGRALATSVRRSPDWGSESERAVARIDAERAARDVVPEVNRLPDGERDVFLLVALDGLEPKEAAAVLGISAPAARVRLSRARRRIRSAPVAASALRAARPELPQEGGPT